MNFSKSGDGLLPAIIQDDRSGAVLMLGYMNEAALAQTRAEGRVTFFSRSKNRLWTKGEVSGHHLEVVSIAADCDADALLIRVRPKGPTCHTGTESCFGNTADTPLATLARLEATVRRRLSDRPAGSYIASLVSAGRDRIVQKVGEEAIETVIAAKNGDDRALVSEAADLIFHLTVLLAERGISLTDVAVELGQREGVRRSG